MSKITEIIENNVFCVSEAEGDYEEVANAMREYAEWYANKCLALVDKMPQEIPIMSFQLPNHE